MEEKIVPPAPPLEAEERAQCDFFDSLAVRFCINLPQAERENLCRQMYHIECMYYFIIDHWSELRLQQDKTSWPLPVKPWTVLEFKVHFMYWLRRFHRGNPFIFEREWQYYIAVYKEAIPVAGAFIYRRRRKDSKYEFVAVKGVGPAKFQRWGFPKGKRNLGESWLHCAQREVREEVSWDAWSQFCCKHRRSLRSVHWSKIVSTNSKSSIAFVQISIHTKSIRIFLVNYTEIMEDLLQDGDDNVSITPLQANPSDREIAAVKWIEWGNHNKKFHTNYLLQKCTMELSAALAKLHPDPPLLQPLPITAS